MVNSVASMRGVRLSHIPSPPPPFSPSPAVRMRLPALVVWKDELPFPTSRTPSTPFWGGCCWFCCSFPSPPPPVSFFLFLSTVLFHCSPPPFPPWCWICGLGVGWRVLLPCSLSPSPVGGWFCCSPWRPALLRQRVPMSQAATRPHAARMQDGQAPRRGSRPGWNGGRCRTSRRSSCRSRERA